MHRSTTQRIRDLDAEGLTIDQRIERAKAAAAERDILDGRVVTAPMLPSDPAPKPCMILDRDDLANIVYHSVSLTLQATTMTTRTAQEYATRAASAAVELARADGWLVE